VSITIKKSENRYSYSSLLYYMPTKIQVKDLWQTQRKY